MLVSFMSFMQVYYITLQQRDQFEAQTRVDLMEALPILRVESTVALNILTAKLKAIVLKKNIFRFGHSTPSKQSYFNLF